MLVPSGSSTLPESSSASGAPIPSTNSPSLAGSFIPKPPKLAKSSATQNLPPLTLNQRIISSLSCACLTQFCSPVPQWRELAPWAYYEDGARSVPDPRVGDAVHQGSPQRYGT